MSTLGATAAGWLAAGATFLTLWLMGALTLQLIGWRSANGLRQVVCDGATGFALAGAWVSVVVMAGAHLHPFQIPGALALLILIAWVRGEVPRVRWSLSSDGTTRLILMGAALALAFAGFLALQDRLWWDGWMMWSHKGQILLTEGGLPYAHLTGEAGYEIFHPDYPLGLPALIWLGWSLAPAAPYLTSTVLGFGLFALVVAGLYGFTVRTADRRTAGLAALALSTFWPLSFFALGGTADILVSLALLGAVACLHQWLRAEPDEGQQLLVGFGVFLLLGVLVKNEGWLVAAAASGVGLIAAWQTGRDARKLALAVAPAALMGLLWWAFTSTLGLDTSFAGEAGSVARADLLDRYLSVWAAVRSYALYVPPWKALAPLGVIGLVGLAAHRAGPERATGWLIWLLVLVGICTIYVAVPIDIGWWIATSFPRVMGQLVPAFLYLAIASYSHARPDAVQ